MTRRSLNQYEPRFIATARARKIAAPAVPKREPIATRPAVRTTSRIPSFTEPPTLPPPTAPGRNRAAMGGPSGTAGTIFAEGVSAAPHPPQNLREGSFRRPQAEQAIEELIR